MQLHNTMSPAARVRADAELWRRVPWLVLLATCGRDRIPTITFGEGWGALDVHVGGTLLDMALIGQWPLKDQGAYIDCRTGQLTMISIDLGGAARGLAGHRPDDPLDLQCLRHVPATDAEAERIADSVGALLDPRPLLAEEAVLLEAAEMFLIAAYLKDFQITPRWHRPGEALEGADAAVLALAGNWTGTVAELIDAATLLESQTQ